MSAKLNPKKVYTRNRLAEIKRQLLNSIEDLREAEYLDSLDPTDAGLGIECALHHLRQVEGSLDELTDFLNIPMSEVHADPMH